jgi:hypothetical protein
MYFDSVIHRKTFLASHAVIHCKNFPSLWFAPNRFGICMALDKGCLLLLGNRSHLCYIQRSMFAPFSNLYFPQNVWDWWMFVIYAIVFRPINLNPDIAIILSLSIVNNTGVIFVMTLITFSWWHSKSLSKSPSIQCLRIVIWKMWKIGILTIIHVGIIPEDIENEEKAMITWILNYLIFYTR